MIQATAHRYIVTNDQNASLSPTRPVLTPCAPFTNVILFPLHRALG